MGMTKGTIKPKRMFLGKTKVKKIALGSEVVWSGGNVVTYITGNGTYQEEVEEGATCLSPASFTPSLNGWTFIGWRTDQTASGSVLDSLVMGEDPVTLYAVFRQTITLAYNGNGATSGSTSAQTGYRYYNNGNVANPSFTVKTNGFARSGYIWTGWKSGSTSYAVGQSVTLSSNLTLSAQWYTAAATNFGYTGGIQTWTVPVTGLYLLKAYGAKGGTNGVYVDNGGKGGYAYRYVQLTAGQIIYIVCGGYPGQSMTGGYNGGGNASGSTGNGATAGRGGGGATHMATRSGTLQQLGSTNGLLLVAAGGGAGGGYKDGYYGTGGAGGGLEGVVGSSNSSNYFLRIGGVGTQTSGGRGHNGNATAIGVDESGAFGRGGNAPSSGGTGSGGGSGLYGGGCGGNYNGTSPGSGGSSYIGTSTTSYKGKTYTNGTTAGQNAGNGSASVQLIAA